MDFRMPMMVPDIERCIPHRYPFLLIDRILAFNRDKSIVATRNVSASDLILQGHFPGNPIFPGVAIVEGIAQAAGVFGRLSTEQECTSFLLADISAARFRRPVVPGDQLVYDVTLLKRRANFFWFTAEAKVDDQIVAEVAFSARMA